jgi:hypothetical protein
MVQEESDADPPMDILPKSEAIDCVLPSLDQSDPNSSQDVSCCAQIDIE